MNKITKLLLDSELVRWKRDLSSNPELTDEERGLVVNLMKARLSAPGYNGPNFLYPLADLVLSGLPERYVDYYIKDSALPEHPASEEELLSNVRFLGLLLHVYPEKYEQILEVALPYAQSPNISADVKKDTCLLASEAFRAYPNEHSADWVADFVEAVAAHAYPEPECKKTGDIQALREFLKSIFIADGSRSHYNPAFYVPAAELSPRLQKIVPSLVRFERPVFSTETPSAGPNTPALV